MSERCTAAANVLVGYQSSRAEQHFIWAEKYVRVSDRQQVPGVPVQPCGCWCPSHIPTQSLAFLLSFSIFGFLAGLYSRSITFRQRHTGAIYRRVVPFLSACVYLCRSEVPRAPWLLTSAVQSCRATETVCDANWERKMAGTRLNNLR